MITINVAILCGRLTKDPETRTAGDTTIVNFSVAVDRRFKRDGQPEADFFDCTAFNKTGEFISKFFHKGSKILINGRLQNNNYTNKEGKTIYRNVVVAENVEFADSKQSQGEPQKSVPKKSVKEEADEFIAVPEGMDEELPFA